MKNPPTHLQVGRGPRQEPLYWHSRPISKRWAAEGGAPALQHFRGGGFFSGLLERCHVAFAAHVNVDHLPHAVCGVSATAQPCDSVSVARDGSTGWDATHSVPRFRHGNTRFQHGYG